MQHFIRTLIFSFVPDSRKSQRQSLLVRFRKPPINVNFCR